MHHGKNVSKTAGMDDSARDALDKQARVKTADLGFHAPDYILDDIIPVTDPKLIYSNTHAQRDRRLRLLIRRYTNQIQYGCRNVNCATPTCLSYRKRNSTAPLRKYTELSARTLACQLVDEYGRSGKDTSLGLCPNEPVVPWYEDPAHAKKRRNSHEKLPQQRQENGHHPKRASLTQHTRDSSKQPPVSDHGARRHSQDGVVEAGRRIRRLDSSIAEGLPEVANLLNTTVLRPSLDKNHARSEDVTRQLSHSSSTPTRPKDLASFTQTLFDLVPLRILNWLPVKIGSSTGDDPVAADGATHQEQTPADSIQDNGTRVEEYTTETVSNGPSDQYQDAPAVHQQPTYSLKTLTWQNVTWLLSKDRKEDPGYHGRFTPFIKQSFAYCLSDPERLCKSVKDIQESVRSGAYKPQDKGDSATKASCSNGQHVPSVVPKHSIATTTPGDMRALLYGLSTLEAFNERDLLMTSVLEALQHSYSLPSWLRSWQSGKHRRSCSASSEKALMKSQRPFDDANACVARPSDIVGPISLLENHVPVIHLEDPQVTELCLVALLFLATTIFNPRLPASPKAARWLDKQDFVSFRDERNLGLAHASFRGSLRPQNLVTMREVIEAIDVSEDWSVHRLLLGLMDAISHRLTIAKWAKTLKTSKGTKSKQSTIVESLVARFDRNFLPMGEDVRSSWIGTVAVELVRTVMLKDWDRSAVIQRGGPVGGALELLAEIYRQRQDLELHHGLFWMPFIAEAFDDMSMPSEWLSFRADNRRMHLLSFSFLFRPEVLVKYFRAMNIAIMKKAHEDAIVVFNDTRQYIWATPAIPIFGAKEVLAHLRPHMAKYFVLTIRRDDILNDAINQIWRRQRQELMRPLRVRIGKDEGEDGLDHGGVQQEFFRLVFSEAFRPDYGMFTVDNITRMAWFQPGSLEPLYRFEALGILMSLAIYNGITIPITMPLAFYRKLLGLKVKKLEHVADGWPELVRGLRTMLEWSHGDVGDVIARTYEFSYEFCGSSVTVDMQKFGRDDPWPPTTPRTSKWGKAKSKSTSFEIPLDSALTPPSHTSPNLSPTIPTAPILSRTSSIELKGISTPQSIDSDVLETPQVEEAALVTNANRAQYVKDYILWLTHKSVEPQYEAFARGFYTCLDRTALSIFTPEALKVLIEGYADIDIDELEHTATYDDYTATDPTILDFWSVVRSMSPEQHKQLLEFVTASDRVPVNGMKSVTFIVQKNGEEDTRLPSSSTCYGRLLLPQYSNKKILEEKLTKAIENSAGFGTL
ncbi:hypothetical protein G647_00421 [Cladophialophora carrionii CBS 160.54]|uniref:HECT-type E3 ubiquitin transferase n=1 Tax=Cladophialophora carrionii CBS 160.54 TaxID=1279043 RepID=V9DPU7_9EURO|nr:uncharacterized protein G647_00421 [Cladophialophora carrionii CBS 160.54]ETI27972.1 hypothetical protein G647_00421 [Cladophialophora carrionii CBS 160.54]